MLRLYRTLLVLLFLGGLGGCTVTVHSQQRLQNLQFKTIAVDTCRMMLDPHTIYRPSLRIRTKETSLDSHTYSLINNTLILNDALCQKLMGDTLYVQYRKFDFDLGKKFRFLDTTQMEKSDQAIYIAYDLRPYENKQNPIFSNPGLNYSGSFSRGFSVGNSQSLVLNSRFDLQLQGDLGDGLRISAAISDDNIPIQPQGNTLILQEFDRVFIEVSKGETAVHAGDFELRSANSYFMSYFKKLKGVGVKHTETLEKMRITTQVNAASSRGKFARQTLLAIEGNQGPYRLTGNANERFIIVLSGTERIYFNGELLKRGQENDYVIDYQSAEVIFSPRRLVSKETRIIIDFEYTDLNYFRTLYTAATRLEHQKFSLDVQFFQEQDSKNASGQLELDSTDIAILSASGDDPQRNTRSGIRLRNEAQVGTGVVTYQLIPNPNFPAEQEAFILRFSTNPDSAIYTASFTEVGMGRGSYEISTQAGVNGRVYRYVGQGQGRYLPIITLIPPEKRQMITIGTQYRANEHLSFEGEFALSQLDKNRFSLIDNEDNNGQAGVFQVRYQRPLTDPKSWSLQSRTKLEVLGESFETLNPYRSAEFIRDWNLSPTRPKTSEQFLQTEIALLHPNANKISYLFNRYTLGDYYTGNRQTIDVALKNEQWAFTTLTTLTQTQTQELNTSFFRPRGRLTRNLGKKKLFQLGMDYEGEYNIRRIPDTDSLQRESYSFDYVKNFLTTDPDKKLSTSFSYNLRKDRFTGNGTIQEAINIRELESTLKYVPNSNSSLLINLKSRRFEVIENELVPNEQSKNTILGSVDYQYSSTNNVLNIGSNYQVNSGQEPRVEFVFTQVDVGRGDYVYVGPPDVAIKNIADFRFDPSNPLADHIRVILPNNEFIRTNNSALNISVRLDPNRRDGASKMMGFQKFLNRWSSQSTARYTKKTLDTGRGNGLKLLDFDPQDTTLVSYLALINHSIFFNRANPRYDVAFNHKSSQNRNNQINGVEIRTLLENEIRSRINFAKNSDLLLSAARGSKSFDVRLFPDRNFDIQFVKYSPELSFRPNTQFRIGLKYEYEERKQQILNQEQAISHEMSLETNYRKTNLFSMDARVSFVNITYDGLANTPIEYDLLDGLKNGNNILWNILITRRLGSNLDLNLNYEGRKAGLTPTLHVGRIQVKATF